MSLRLTAKEAADRFGIDLTALGTGRVAAVPAPRVAKTAASRPRPSAPRAHPKAGRLPYPPPCDDPGFGFHVPGRPVPKQRARTFLDLRKVVAAFAQSGGSVERFKALLGGIKHSSFTPDGTAEYERLVGQVAAAAMRSRPPYGVPVEVTLLITLEGDPTLCPTDGSDPDIDNVAKAVLDGLNGIAWTDDRLVQAKTSRKVCGPVPGVAVTVRPARSDAG